jgi:hypothetical protein
VVRQVLRVGVIFLLGLLVISGCAGGSQSASTAHITKKQWVQKAFAICRRLGHEQQRRYFAFERSHGMKVGAPGQQELERVNTILVLPFVERKINELRALSVPTGEQAKIEKILKSMEEGIRVSKAHPEWLATPTQAHPDPFTKTLELTSAYGIWDCGQA